MRTEIRPFTEHDRDAAARLLAARHRIDRTRTPALSSLFDDSAAGPEPYELYRQMYAALAPHFLQHGAFIHDIELHAGDETAMRAWVSLGFGQISTLAARDTTPVAAGDATSHDRI